MDTSKVQEGELSFFISSTKEFLHQPRESSLWKASEEQLKYNVDKNPDGTALIPINVSRIVEPGKKFLLIEREEKPWYIIVDFLDSREDLDAWYELISKYIGQSLGIRQRSHTEPSTLRKSPKKYSRKERETRGTSATQLQGQSCSHAQVDCPLPAVEECPDSDVPLCQEFLGLRIDCSSSERDSDSTNTASLSPPSSLTSTDWSWNREQEIKKLQEERDGTGADIPITLASLGEITFADYRNGVYVRESGFLPIVIGDMITTINGCPTTDENAHKVMEILHSNLHGTEEITVGVQRFPHGNMCVISQTVYSWDDLGISVDGTKITMESGGLFRKSCDPAKGWFEGHKCDRSITRVNNQPLCLRMSSDEVETIVREAINGEQPIVFHVHPTDFLQTLEAYGITRL